MARYNEILTGRYNRLLQKLFSMKGAPPAPQLASEITTTFNLFSGVENRFLEQWERYGLAMGQAGVVGQLSSFRIRNPLGSNVIAVIESIEVNSATDLLIVVYTVGTADFATQNFGSNLNSGRKGTSGTLFTGSTCITSHATVVAGLANPIRNISITGTQSRELISNEDQEITLAPNEALSIQNNTVNLTTFVSFVWRERFLEESERA